MSEKGKELENIDNLILIGCGTSYTAALFSSFFFKDLCKFGSVQVIDGADFLSIIDVPKGRTCLILLLSIWSDKRFEHRCTVQIAKEYELFTIGIINVVDSLTVKREVDCGCYLHGKRSSSSINKIIYITRILVLLLVSVWYTQTYYPHESILKRKQIISDLFNLNIDIKKTLKTQR